MEGEINNLIMVWSSVLMSLCYCYGTTKLVPKGTTRFFMFLPVVCLFLHLPLLLRTVTFSNPTSYFVTWLTSFKLLLLAFGTGPLSKPSLSLTQFVLISCLPITLQPESPNTNKYKNISLRPLSHYAKKGLLLIFLISLGFYKDKLPRNIFSFLICLYVYIGLEVLLGFFAVLGQTVLGTQVDPPFTDPYLSTSLQDFWGRRWNRVSSSSLRSTVFYPIFNNTSRLLGRKWAAVLSLVVTFIVSDVLHQMLFYYLGRERFGWGTPIFFLFHGLCVVIEPIIKGKINVKWRLPQIVTGPLIFGFVIFTFIWLILPELMEHNIAERVLEEYAAFASFAKNLSFKFILHIWQPGSTRL